MHGLLKRDEHIVIIAKLIGGLGNQCFQYAAGRHLAEIHRTEFKIDISEYEQLQTPCVFPEPLQYHRKVCVTGRNCGIEICETETFSF